jgi:queuine tRNA-ribosyltransferase
VLAEAKKAWTEVSLARGKGRLAREKEKLKQDTLGTAVELN